MRTTSKLIIFVFTFLTLAASAYTVASTPDPLPPAAQEAVNKGVIAAKVPDYLLAIRYFEEARKLAPEAPVIYLNMGLAESRIPGRELRAIAWFGAYLAAYPGAPNAAAVKEQVAVLEVRNQSNVSRFLKTVQDTASQLSDKNGDQSWGLGQVADLRLGSGDIAEAQKTADLIRLAKPKSIILIAIAKERIKAGDLAGAKNTLASAQKSALLIGNEPSLTFTSSEYQQRDQLAEIASVQATANDIAGARETADLIENKFAYQINLARTAIAEAQIKAGDRVGAQKTLTSAIQTADLIESAYHKRVSLSVIAEVQIKAGDMADAKNTLSSALKAAELIEEAHLKSMAQSDIAELQTQSGDVPGALKTLVSAQDSANLIKDVSHKSIARSLIAEAQIKAGDLAGAKTSLTSAQNFAGLIKDKGDSYGKDWALSALAQAQAKSGDITSAQKNAGLVQDVYQRSAAQKTITEVQAKSGIAKASNSTRQSTSAAPIQPVIKVSDWLKKLDDGDEINDCPLNAEPFLDITGHLKSLPGSGDLRGTFDALSETAWTIVKAQNVIAGMLKQQVGK